MARKIVITSGKGGVGKTTITANIGILLAKLNKRVVLFDTDIGLNNLDVVLGVENKVVYDLVDVLQGKCRAKQALIQHFDYPNLYVMPSSKILNSSYISAKHIRTIIDSLNDFVDYIILDCPAGIDAGFHRAVFSAEEAIIVTTPHISAIRDADKVVTLLAGYNINNVHCIVNRVRGDMILNGEMIDVDEIAKQLHVKLVGAIPEDDDISKLSILGKTIDENSQSYRAFILLTNNIINNSRLIFDCTKKYKGFWGNIKRGIRKRI